MNKDKVYSSRLNEKTIFLIRELAHELRAPSKAVIEHAVMLYWKQIHESHKSKQPLLQKSFGAWKNRTESPEAIVKSIKKTFNEGFSRHER